MNVRYFYTEPGEAFALVNVKEDFFSYYTAFPENNAKIMKAVLEECKERNRVFRGFRVVRNNRRK